MKSPAPRPLGSLLRAVTGAQWPPTAEALPIRGLAVDSRRVQPGDLFVAICGLRVDSHTYLGDAVRRGAVAAVVEREVEDVGVPLIRVEDGRRALAELAAEWYGRPVERLPLVGITGSFGKTTVLMMLEAILQAAGRRIGAIGSELIGIRLQGAVEQKSSFTTPDALTLQHGLARLEAAGAELAAMEVTSHALAQQRVHGLRFQLGIFTNLVPLEHSDYHPSFRQYAETRCRFLDHLREGAPLIYHGGTAVLRTLVQRPGIRPVACGFAEEVAVRIQPCEVNSRGTQLRVHILRPLPRAGGGEIPPGTFPLELSLLGRPHLHNAVFAATAALCLGAEIEAVQQALSTFPAPRRRMQIAHRGRFTVLDDTAGHPESLSAVFEVVQKIPHRRLHRVCAVRGQRGAELNRQEAITLGIWSRVVPITSLVVTRSLTSVQELDRVEEKEYRAFLSGLRAYRLSWEERDELEDAVASALERAGEGDLVVLLGAQGMDAGAAVLESWHRRARVPA